jgi:glutamate-1-semialdehyde 2,1-aminomutase
MAAGLATLELCAEAGFYQKLSDRTRELAAGLKQAAQGAGVTICTDSEGGMLGLTFTKSPIQNFSDAKAGDHARYAKFFHAMLDRGVWLPPSSYEAMFVSAAHTSEHIREMINAASSSFREVA